MSFDHIETNQLICYENQMPGFYMIFCKSSKSVCFIEDYGDFRDSRGTCFSIFIFILLLVVVVVVVLVLVLVLLF